MITETGHVVAIDPDGLWVETLKKSACAQCSAQKGCGQKVVSDHLSGANMTMIKAFFAETSSSEAWHVGDQAVLGVDEFTLVKSALLAYVVPLVLMIFFAVLVSFYTAQDVYVVVSALLGLAVGGGITRFLLRYTKDAKGYHPVVLSKVISSS